MRKLRKVIILLLLILTLTSWVTPVYADSTNDYKTFSQLDDRWAGYVYGGGKTIGGAGCFITSFAVQMAYANPDLRDVNTFNPKILAQGLSFDGDMLYQTTVNNVDSTFHWESQEFTSGGSSVESRIKELLDAGKYVIVRAGPPIAAGTTHFSPIVGWDNEKNQPKIMDVAGGNHPTWEEWAPYVNRLDVCSSDIQSSMDAYSSNTDDIQSNAPETEEEKQELQELIDEWDLEGMPAINSIADLQEDTELKGRDDLSLTEQRRVAEVKAGIDANGFSFPDWFNHAIFFIGILVMVYSILLLMAILFDYSNNFIEFSLVEAITLKRCRIVDKDYYQDNKPTGYDKGKDVTNLTFGMLLFRCVFLMVIGIGIMSGIAQEIIVYFINKIMEVVG